MKNTVIAPIKPPASDEARRAIESSAYWDPEKLVVRRKGYGADGRESLEVDETVIYSLLRHSERAVINGEMIAFGKLQPVCATSWDGSPVVYDGRQRRKAASVINERMALIVDLRRKLGEDGEDLATLRNACIEKSELAPKSWGWATAEALPLYIGGRVGDAKIGFDAPGLLGVGGAIPFRLWTVFQNVDPDSMEMRELSTSAEHARVKTPPSKLARRIQSMIDDMPISHVARLLTVTVNTLHNRLLILKVEPKVQEAVDLGGEDGGISWRQLSDEFFVKDKEGKTVPIDPVAQLAKLDQIAGTKKRGAKPGEKRGALAVVADAEPATAAGAAAGPTTAAKPATAPGATVVKLTPNLLRHLARDIEDAMNTADEDEAKLQLEAMAVCLRFVAGDPAILDEFPIARDVLIASIKKVGGEGATFTAPTPKPAEIPPKVAIANTLLDLCEKWVKTRMGKGPFTPNWPQGENLSREVIEALAASQSQYRAHEAECAIDGSEPESPSDWFENWVTNEILTPEVAKAA